MRRSRRRRSARDRLRPRLTKELLDAPVHHSARVVARAFLDVAVAERKKPPHAANALHDFRVSLRRLRSWLRAYRPWLPQVDRGRARRSLATIARASNQARDAEVGLEWLQAQRGLPLHARHQLQHLAGRLRHELHVATHMFQHRLARGFAPVVVALQKELQSTADELVFSARSNPRMRVVHTALLQSHAADLGRALRRVRTIEHESFAHRARIAGKRLRYLLEPLTGNTEARRAVQRLARMQDALGELHDACVLGERLRFAHSVLAHRAMQRTTQAFQHVARGWLGAGTDELLAAIARVKCGPRTMGPVSSRRPRTAHARTGAKRVP
ncbi:MAG: CHAD domain-containing protein [Gemmatimonadales bacterium]